MCSPWDRLTTTATPPASTGIAKMLRETIAARCGSTDNLSVRRGHRDVLVRDQPSPVPLLEAGSAANPVARSAPARPRAGDEREVMTKRSTLARRDAQVLELKTERTFERAEPAFEVLAIFARAARVQRRLHIEHLDVGRVERHEVIEVLVADRLGELVDAFAEHGFDGG